MNSPLHSCKPSLQLLPQPLTAATTDLQGYFRFKFNDLIFLDQNAKYTFGIKSGSVIPPSQGGTQGGSEGVVQDTIFKTIEQWISVSPVTLTLKKLTAGFINDTVQCYNDTVHFTNKTLYGKTPYTYNWSFGDGGFLPPSQGGTQGGFVSHKFPSSGIFPVTLIATDALGCKDTTIKQIIIPECPGIYGYLSEHAECGGSPVIGDTLYFVDEFGNTYDTIFAVTNTTGQFTFNMSKVNQLDTTYNYSFKIKSGYGISQIQCNPISYWKNSSPLSFITDHKEYWTRDFNISDSAICSNSIIDLDRNIYVAGTAYYPGTKRDYMLIKYNPVGDELWHISYNPTGFGDYTLTDMKADKSGNIILTGKGDDGAVTAKINTSGSIVWSNTWTDDYYFGSSGYLAIDTLNNIYVASNVLDPSNQFYFALTKYNSSGEKLWSNVYNTTSMVVRNIIIDKLGNVIVLCNQSVDGSYIFKNNSSGVLLWSVVNSSNLLKATVGNDNSVYATGSTITTNNWTAIITVKYTSAGSSEWTQTYNYESSHVNQSDNILVDKDGNIIVGGIVTYYSTQGTNVYLLPNRYSIIKYNPSGSQIWLNSFSLNSTAEVVSPLLSMVSDIAGNIYTAGTKQFIVTLPRTGTKKIYNQFLTAKFNSEGSFEWLESVNTNRADYSYPPDLIVSDNENIYVTGITTLNGVYTIKYVQCPSNANNARYSHAGDNTNNSTTNEQSNNEQLNNKHQTSNSKLQTSNEFVTMFPNPNDGNFYFNYNILPPSQGGTQGGSCRFAVFDQIGKKIYDIEIKSGKNTVMINHNNFSNGVYYYQVTAGNRLVKTERLVITK
ncbi:MAG: PKD domain-containing protein [Bacteroidia bacterium]|nr:PKD domain-containing protein [Bacteroidia bacterium]